MKTRTGIHRFNRRIVAVGTGLALAASGAIGAQTFADDSEGGAPEPPPGVPVVEEPPPAPDLGDDNTLIQVSGSTYDPTVLTTFIPASAFDPQQGVGVSADQIVTNGDNGACYGSGPVDGFNAVTVLRAPVSLPDNARIKQVRFYGIDNGAGNVAVALLRENFTFTFAGGGVWTRGVTTVDSFSTAGESGVAVVSGADDLEEIAGSSSPILSITRPHNFHTIRLSMNNDQDQQVCGVEVDYQVATSSSDPGTVFHPVESFRAFDSRQATFGPLSGRLAPNGTKVIDVTDGYDDNGVAIPAQADLIPSNATSITYNITVAGQTGPNFVAVTSGDAASFTASAINYPGSGSLANAGTVTLAADQTIKVWGGDNTGSAHVIIDVTGYYAPAPPFPNMGN